MNKNQAGRLAELFKTQSQTAEEIAYVFKEINRQDSMKFCVGDKIEFHKKRGYAYKSEIIWVKGKIIKVYPGRDDEYRILGSDGWEVRRSEKEIREINPFERLGIKVLDKTQKTPLKVGDWVAFENETEKEIKTPYFIGQIVKVLYFQDLSYDIRPEKKYLNILPGPNEDGLITKKHSDIYLVQGPKNQKGKTRIKNSSKEYKTPDCPSCDFSETCTLSSPCPVLDKSLLEGKKGK